MDSELKRKIYRVLIKLLTWVIFITLVIVLFKSCVGGPPHNYR